MRARLINVTRRMIEFSRTDGSEPLQVDSDEFHVLFFDNKTVTINGNVVIVNSTAGRNTR
jgi:hypothetical protein